jgi:hypothetical protein
MTYLSTPWRPALTALSLAAFATLAHADERESLESLRQTTLGLIDALVAKGVITRDAAEAMLSQAKARAAAVTQASPGAAEPVATGKPVQRIPYVSEATKAQIRNEVKEEVLTQARAERWGVPNATPAWVDRIKIDGDFRFRHQSDRPKSDNTPAYAYQDAFNDPTQAMMRSPEFAAQDSYLQSRASTTDDRDRERIRLRLGLTAKVADEVGVGVRLTTGNGDDRVSTNQTLGNNFNKYQLFVDRAYVRLDPTEWLTLNAGRIPNPWFSTDMVWSENLNFDGAALTARWARPDQGFEPFATVGAFPLRDGLAPLRNSRWLYGAQLGAAWQAAERTRIKAGLALYDYKNIEGREDTDYTVTSALAFVPGVSYGQYAYPQGSLGQKGNTLFETNPGGATPVYGLAYRFRPMVLTLSAEFTHFSPYSLLLSAEYVKNTAFSESDFRSRAGLDFAAAQPGGHDAGYHLKLGLGYPEVREQGQWLAALSYKRVGSDAVLDAFTDSDLGLGGTNVQGYTLSFAYGLYRNTSIGLRYLVSKSIDSPINAYNPDARFGVSTLQVDLNVRF